MTKIGVSSYLLRTLISTSKMAVAILRCSNQVTGHNDNPKDTPQTRAKTFHHLHSTTLIPDHLCNVMPGHGVTLSANKVVLQITGKP